MVFNGVVTLAADLAPPKKLGQAIGLCGAASIVANAVAPMIAEPIADNRGWGWVFLLAGGAALVTALLALYFNVFVLVIQSFLKIPVLTAVAPGNPPSGPVFAVVQGVVLVFFVLMIIGAWRRFRPS